MHTFTNTVNNSKPITALNRWMMSMIMLIMTLFSSLLSFSQTFNASTTYTVPAGVTSITVVAWGAGGGGGSSSNACAAQGNGGGGGGGGLAMSTLSVAPGQVYTVTVGNGGTASVGASGGTGGTTTFNGPGGTVTATGGTGGATGVGCATNNAGGTGGIGTQGTTFFSGGNGSQGFGGSSASGIGTGGGGAGSGSNGSSTANGTCPGIGSAGGTGSFPGGRGGYNPACTLTTGSGDVAGVAGIQPGGGGSGAGGYNSALAGGVGGAGRVLVLVPCTSPTNQPTGLTLSPVSSSQINGSFTVASGSDSYLIVRYPTGNSPTDPVDGTTYSAGGSLGTGTVAAIVTSGTFSASGLTLATTYDFYVYSMNSLCTNGPKYLVTTPLTGTAATPAFSGSTSLGGLWSSPATWATGVVPPAGENVVITAGSIVTIDQIITPNNLTIDGILQWNGTANSPTIGGNVLVSASGKLLAYTTGGAGVVVNIAGNYTNNGYANHGATIASNFALNFNGTSGSTLGGNGIFEGDGTRGIIRSLAFQNTGANTISTSQNLTVPSSTGGLNGFGLTGGSVNTNGKLKIDNTAQIYGRPINLQVASVAVTTMGAGYSTNAPVVFGVTVTKYPLNASVALNTRYFAGTNVYLCTTAGTSGAANPTSTGNTPFADGTAQLLYIGNLGQLGLPYQTTANNTIGTQYAFQGTLYTALNVAAPTVAGAAALGTSVGTVYTAGTAQMLCVGTAASVSVNFDATTQSVRSLTLTSPGSGYSSAPLLVFSNSGTTPTTAAVAAVVYFQQIIGVANSLFQKTMGTATITGGININSDQGTSIATLNGQASSGVGGLSTTNGGVNYTVVPTIGFAGPTALNLVSNPGTIGSYSTAPTITVDPTNLVSGTNLTSSNFTITMNQGQIVSVYLNASTTATYSAPPALTLSSALGGAAIAWPSGCWPSATALIGSNKQLTDFTINSPGFGYVVAPTVGIGTTSGGVLGGTFTTAAAVPTSRIALYNLTLSFFLPATSVTTNTDDASIPASRKLNNLTIGSTGGAGLSLSGNLTLFGTNAVTAPLVLTASSVAPFNIIDLGGNNLNFTWNGFAGITSTFGATNTYIKNGSMSLVGRGGASTFNYPFSGQFTWFAGSTPTAVTTGSTVTKVTVTETGAPSGTGALGTRAFLVNNNAGTQGLNPTVTMNYNTVDALPTGLSATSLFIGQSTALSGPWNPRSASSGSGTIGTSGSRTTATTAPGPLVPTGNDYFSWVTLSIDTANFSIEPPTCAASSHLVSVDVTSSIGTISTVTITYNNGAAVGPVAMTNIGGNTWQYTIPAATPSNAVVTYTIIATNNAGISKTFTGNPYQDNPTQGLTATASASINPVCSGSATSLSIAAATNPSYTAPPAVANPTTDEDMGNIMITQGATTILNNTTAGGSLVGTIGTATGTAGSYSNFTAAGPYALTAGATYNGSVTSITQGGSFGNAAAVWIDYNRNGSFADAGEQVYNQGATITGPHTSTFTFTVPSAAARGVTRMRVLVNEGTISGPTITPSWGEYEEYSVNIGYDSYSWSDGTNVVGTTNPLTVNPTTTTTYTATLGISGCTFTASPVTVNVNPLPAAPSTGPGNPQCGTGTPSVFASSPGFGDGSFRWYLTQTGGTALLSTTGTPTLEVNQTLVNYPITVTTTFYVSVTNGTCESSRTPVTATVNQPDPIQAVVDNNNPCANTAISLSVQQTGTSNNYTYTWTASPVNGSGIPTSVSGSPVSVTPTIANTYTYAVTAVDAALGCTTGSTVSVTVKALPVIDSVKANPATAVCAGTSVTLNGYSALISSGPQTPPGYTAPPAVANPTTDEDFGNITITRGATTILNNSTPVNSLTGTIGTATGTAGSYSNFTAFGPYTLTKGLTYNFSLSSITTGSSFSNAMALYIDYNRNGVFTDAGEEVYNQGATISGPHTVTGSFTVPANVTAGTARMRVLVNEGTISGPTITPSWGEYEEYLVNLQGVNPQNPNLTYTWTPGPLTGPTVTVTPLITTTYNLTAFNPATGCTSAPGSVTVTVNPIPPQPTGTPSDQCGTRPPDASVSSNSGAPSPTFNWYAAASGGTPLQTSTSTTYLSNISATTTLYVSEISAFGCESSREPVLITVSDPDALTVSVTGNNLSLCLGSSTSITSSYTPDFNSFATFNLTATGGSASGVTGTVSLTPNATGSDPYSITPTAAGSYTYTITANDPDKGCTSVGTISITVNSNPVVDSARVSPATICSGQSSSLKVYSGIISSGPQTLPAYTLPGTTSNTGGDHITLVTFSTINNSTTTGGTNGFVNYTSISAPTINSGSSYSLTVHVANGGTEYAGVWFDWNRNGIYDASEFYNVPLTLATDWVGTINVTVPANAASGVIGMRVRSEYFTAITSADAYSAYTYGETEEYKVNVLGVITQNPALTYTWNPGALSGATVSVTPTVTTTYTATVTNAAGCSVNSAPVTVTVNPLPATPSTNSPVTRCGPGSVTLTASGAGGAINWYNAATGGTPLFTGNSYTTNVTGSTSFWVAETSEAGCEGPRSQVVVTVTTPPALTITAASSTTFCQGGSVVLNKAPGSDASYVNFTWSASPSTGAGLSSTSGPSITVAPTVAGTYTITLTANDGGSGPTGCSNTTTATITVNPNPATPNPTATPASICAGGSSQLNAGTLVAGTLATPTLGGNGNAGNVFDITATNTVTINSFTMGITAGTQAEVYYKAGSYGCTASLTSSAGWTLIGQVAITPAGASPAQTTIPLAINVTIPAGQTYGFVVVCNGSNYYTNGTTLCNPWASDANITVGEGIGGTGFGGTFGFTNSPRNFNGTVGYSFGDPNLNYLWNPATGLSSSTIIDPVASPTSTTTYTVTATNSFSCSATSAPITVTVAPVGATASATPGTSCAGTAVTLNASPTGGSPFSFSWSNGATVVGTTNPLIVNPTVTTTYTVTVMDACGNPTTSSVTVTVNPLPTVSVTPTTATFCSPGTGITLTASGASTYAWLPVAGLSASTGSSVVASPTTGTIYTVTGTDANGCTNTATANISVAATPTATAAASPTTLCAGTPLNLTSSGSVPATGYTVGAIPVSAQTPGGTATVLATGGTATPAPGGNSLDDGYWDAIPLPFTFGFFGNNYTTVRIGTNGTVQFGPVVATGGNPGNSSWTSQTIPTAGGYLDNFIAGPWIDHDLSSTPFGTLRYFVNGVAPNRKFVISYENVHVFLSSDNNTSQVIINENGTIDVLLLGGGLTSTATKAIGVENATGSLGTAAPGRNSGTWTTAADEAWRFSPVVTNFSYAWTGPASFSSAVQNPLISNPTTANTGTYSVIVTNTATGCSSLAASTAAVTVNPRPTGIISGGGTYCAGANTATTLSIAVTGAGPWSGTLSDGTAFSGSTSPISVTVTPSSTTTYTIATLNGSQCSSIAADLTGSATVTVNPLAATPAATVTQPTCAVGTGTINVTSPLGSGNSYSIGGAYQSSPTFSGVAPGSYTLSVQNSFGCFAPATTTVTVNAQPFTPAAPVITGIVNVCPYIGTGTQITYHATATGNGTTTFNWVIPPTLVTIISGQGTADLTVTFQAGFAAQPNKQLRVTATNQCGTSAMTIYYLLAQLPTTPNAITGPVDACPLLGGPAQGTYTINKVVGATSYLWSSQSGTTTITHTNGTGVNDTTITVLFASGFTTSAITVQSVNECGTSSARSITVTRNAPSVPGPVSGPTNACAYIAPNGTAATYSVLPVAGVSYTWTIPAGSTGFTGQGTNSISFTYPAGYTGGSLSVIASTGCGASAPRTLTITTLNPATPSVIDVINTVGCPNRQYTYSLSAMPANATSVSWMVPVGATIVSGQGTTSITVSYPGTAVQGTVTAQAINNCGSSVVRSSAVKLPACAAGFAGKTESPVKSEPLTVQVVDMEVKIFPNPSVADFKLQVLTSGRDQIHVRVLDAAGRALRSFDVLPSEVISLGSELKAGAYLVEVRQGDKLKTTKILKF